MLILGGVFLGQAAIMGHKSLPANAIMDGPATEWYRPEGEAGVVPQYKGDEWKGPTWPKPAEEPSISWKVIDCFVSASVYVFREPMTRPAPPPPGFHQGDG